MKTFFRGARIIGLFLFIALAIPTLALYSENARPPVRVILIGWDGAQREHVKECLSCGQLPQLQAIITAGMMVDIDVKGVTDTKAGWSEILTGYGPAITGVYSNSRFKPIPEGFTLFERLKNVYGPDFITVAVVGKDHHVGGYAAEIKRPLTIKELDFLATRKKIEADHDTDLPGEKKPAVMKSLQQGTVIEIDGIKYLYSPAEPYFYTWKNVDVWEKGLGENRVVGDKALQALEKYRDKSFFFFIHFADVDHQGHKFGENSKEYNDALISSDEWTGRVIAKLKDLGIYENTLIYVTADHGFDEGQKNHTHAPTVFLATNDKLVKRSGTRADIAPTIYKRLGIGLDPFEPKLTGRSLD